VTVTFTITRARLPLLILLALVLAVASTGAVLAARSVGGSESEHGHAPVPNGPLTAAQGIPTSFGAVAVEYAVRLTGLTSKDLAGMTHGIQNYVPPESAQVQVAVTLANQLERTQAYSPGQFRLIAGTKERPSADAKRLTPTGATFKPGTLQPDAAIEGTVSFVVPSKRAHLWVEFRDPGRKRPLLVELGRPTVTRPGAAGRPQPKTPAPPTTFDGTSPRHADGAGH
jgi:uncharacterized protein DUF4352